MAFLEQKIAAVVENVDVLVVGANDTIDDARAKLVSDCVDDG